MLLAISYLVFSTILLVLPGSAIPKDNWFDRLWVDKWVHVAMLFIMVVLWFAAFYSRGKSLLKNLIWVTVAAMFYGVAMEFVQHHFVRHRSYDTGDMVADCVGSVGGFIFCWYRYIKK